MTSYEVRVEKEELTFCAAHFITYGGGECESLHGHNYRVGIAVTGSLNEYGYVIDFVRLRRAARELLEPLDHRLLLPRRNPRFRIREEGGSVEVRVESTGRGYRFPRSDVVFLPVENTTAEHLAAYLGARLEEPVREGSVAGAEPIGLSVEVEESPGSSAVHTREVREG